MTPNEGIRNKEAAEVQGFSSKIKSFFGQLNEKKVSVLAALVGLSAYAIHQTYQQSSFESVPNDSHALNNLSYPPYPPNLMNKLQILNALILEDKPDSELSLERLYGGNICSFENADQRKKVLILQGKNDGSAISPAALNMWFPKLNKDYDIKFKEVHTPEQFCSAIKSSTLEDTAGNFLNIIVNAHGDPDGMILGNNSGFLSYDSVLVARSLKQECFKNLPPDLLITLISCKTGLSDTGFAARLSAVSQKRVVAPSIGSNAAATYYAPGQDPLKPPEFNVFENGIEKDYPYNQCSFPWMKDFARTFYPNGTIKEGECYNPWTNGNSLYSLLFSQFEKQVEQTPEIPNNNCFEKALDNLKDEMSKLDITQSNRFKEYLKDKLATPSQKTAKTTQQIYYTHFIKEHIKKFLA